MKLRLVCISDTHCKYEGVVVPPADVLIHAGDALYKGTQYEFLEFVNWMSKLTARFKLYVPGNHDRFVEHYPRESRALLARAGIRLLIDEVAGIQGVRFYGSPWVPHLKKWAFYGDDLTLTKKFNRIDDGTEVLITHDPPHEIGDLTSHSHVGSIQLAKRIKELEKLKLHVSGHIHECYGIRTVNGVDFVNAAICTREYKPLNKPIVMEIECRDGRKPRV